MKFRVCLGVKSTFTAIALRKVLSDESSFRLLGEERDCAGVERLLKAQNDCVALVDIELFQEPDGQQLQTFLTLRREPTLIISPRGLPLPASLANKPCVRLLSGRVAGELDLAHIQNELPRAVQAVREAFIQTPSLPPVSRAPATVIPAAKATLSPPSPSKVAPELVVIGISTGGPPLLMRILKEVIKPTIPFLIAQHMPAGESAGFAKHLSEETGHNVVEAGRGTIPEAGLVGLVSAGYDFEIYRGLGNSLRLREVSIPENPFHPSIDNLLKTAADAGIATHCMILTGMGQDGAKGAHALMLQGYPVVAQRPDTCAVAGMPSATINNGASRDIQSPEQIINTLNRWFRLPARPLAY